MKNWKISKLRIQGFKAFPKAFFDFEASSLLTLEGPNGYGKTSVFDAIELLLTGNISRISDLYDVVMTAQKKLYKDNLYWNTKAGEKDLEIRVELIDVDTGAKEYFIRIAAIADLKKAANNKPDYFDLFKLYKLDDFDQMPKGTPLVTNIFDNYLGENFCNNYSMLNYLQQGQNSFIFSRRITDRKKSLELLLKTREAKEQIDACKRLELKIGQSCSAEELGAINGLQQKISALSNVNLNQQQLEKYQKISSTDPAPNWDAVDPYPELNEGDYKSHASTLEILSQALSQKDEIKVLLGNAQIENYISKNSEIFELALKIGKHIWAYDELNNQSQKLNSLKKAKTTLAKAPVTIAVDDLSHISDAGIVLDEGVEVLIKERDILAKQLSGKNSEIVELNRVRLLLAESHKISVGADDPHCVLCGYDWKTIDGLKLAIDTTTDKFDAEIGSLAKQVKELHDAISSKLDPIKIVIAKHIQDIEGVYQKPLHDVLVKNSARFEQIRALNETLAARSIEYSGEFTVDAEELAARKANLEAQLRAHKRAEGAPPPEGWLEVIKDTFSKIDDFYSLAAEILERKRAYLLLKHREKQSATLTVYRDELKKKTDIYNAALAAKAKVSRLKAALTEEEKDYAARTISNIELIFHIYSGRLIQNYQRGLGLFIDDGDGKQLQFCTAERSEHDATLSMSSGQLSALSLSFFLSLNRVYSENAFVLIDDPAQSLDEINIASLTDLLRCELKDRQLIISSHEDDIAGYMRYRFNKAGLSQKLFHMQSHTEVTANA